jgi:hypothetical protein
MEAGNHKRAAFIRLAEKRTNVVMDKIRILSNLANRNSYEYSEDDVQHIFGAIEEELRVARNRFEATKRRRPEFTLRTGRAEEVAEVVAPNHADEQIAGEESI